MTFSFQSALCENKKKNRKRPHSLSRKTLSRLPVSIKYWTGGDTFTLVFIEAEGEMGGCSGGGGVHKMKAKEAYKVFQKHPSHTYKHRLKSKQQQRSFVPLINSGEVRVQRGL